MCERIGAEVFTWEVPGIGCSQLDSDLCSELDPEIACMGWGDRMMVSGDQRACRSGGAGRLRIAADFEEGEGA